jgi:hypothetical protein
LIEKPDKADILVIESKPEETTQPPAPAIPTEWLMIGGGLIVLLVVVVLFQSVIMMRSRKG